MMIVGNTLELVPHPGNHSGCKVFDLLIHHLQSPNWIKVEPANFCLILPASLSFVRRLPEDPRVPGLKFLAASQAAIARLASRLWRWDRRCRRYEFQDREFPCQRSRRPGPQPSWSRTEF